MGHKLWPMELSEFDETTWICCLGFALKKASPGLASVNWCGINTHVCHRLVKYFDPFFWNHLEIVEIVGITHHMLLTNTAWGTCLWSHHVHFFGLFLALASAFALALAAAFCFADRADSRLAGFSFSGAEADGFGNTGLRAGCPDILGSVWTGPMLCTNLIYLLFSILMFETQTPPHAILQIHAFHSPQGWTMKSKHH